MKLKNFGSNNNPKTEGKQKCPLCDRKVNYLLSVTTGEQELYGDHRYVPIYEKMCIICLMRADL